MWENAQNLFSLVIYSHLPHSHPQAYKAKLYMILIFFLFSCKSLSFHPKDIIFQTCINARKDHLKKRVVQVKGKNVF